MTNTIKKILIANRGEIACRVIRTAKERGIATVAVYSDADKAALHVLQADEAIHIGGNASADSYLRIDNIIRAAKASGADAIHPGFGFLSENAEFAKALSDAGIIFIGPDVRAIQAMGDKIESKKLANAASVNTVPGHPDAVPDADKALEIAKQVGCPVMLKASAGGGGKGMRIAHTLDDVKEGFTSAQNEARTSFGDDRVFVEKYIEQPRHIEIQVIADRAGNCLYLGERECSIQRRHQKVIEEAPSSFISDATRKKMGQQAVQLAQAVDYVSAGTVEFIVDKNEEFYFLEMNTRLQVEHPVTECITGLDIVSLMIDVAEGKSLELKQQNIKLNGWSFEARVYAEDPDRGFLPSIGRITQYEPPRSDGAAAGIAANATATQATNASADAAANAAASAAVIATNGAAASDAYIRVDTGIQSGGEISMYYDPMIAKLITWAPTRSAAIDMMEQALDHYRIEGVKHNIPFLSALFAHPALKAGELTTQFIDDYFPDGFSSGQYRSASVEQLPVLAAWLETQLQARNNPDNAADAQVMHVFSDGDSVMGGDDNSANAGNTADSNVNDSADANNSADKESNNTQHVIDPEALNRVSGNWSPGQWIFNGQIDGKPISVAVQRMGNSWRLSHRGSVNSYNVYPDHIAALLQHMPVKTQQDLSSLLLSPMPGLLIKVLVQEGDEVSTGQELAVIEAMKMENTLRSEINGKVAKVIANAGDSLAVDATIMEFE